MSKQELTATFPTDSAVELRKVTKTFTQWQRDNTGKGLLKNLINTNLRQSNRHKERNIVE